jgi:hypothetical protein
MLTLVAVIESPTYYNSCIIEEEGGQRTVVGRTFKIFWNLKVTHLLSLFNTFFQTLG